MVLFVFTAIGVTSCIKIELPFGKGSPNNTGNTRELAGVEYTIIKPKDYATKLKAGEIGTGERYVIEGLVMGVSDKTLMLQQSGLTNIFSLNEPIELSLGKRVRVYVEVVLVNTMIINASEAKVILLEEL
jgi:hypothetical protein